MGQYSAMVASSALSLPDGVGLVRMVSLEGPEVSLELVEERPLPFAVGGAFAIGLVVLLTVLVAVVGISAFPVENDVFVHDFPPGNRASGGVRAA